MKINLIDIPSSKKGEGNIDPYHKEYIPEIRMQNSLEVTSERCTHATREDSITILIFLECSVYKGVCLSDGISLFIYCHGEVRD